jgi:hypothetical protein
MTLGSPGLKPLCRNVTRSLFCSGCLFLVSFEANRVHEVIEVADDEGLETVEG